MPKLSIWIVLVETKAMVSFLLSVSMGRSCRVQSRQYSGDCQATINHTLTTSKRDALRLQGLGMEPPGWETFLLVWPLLFTCPEQIHRISPDLFPRLLQMGT